MLLKKRLENSKKYTSGQIIFPLIYSFSFILILKEADTAIEYMKTGLLLCARTVIPSLFPFMVISELIVKSGLGEVIGNIIGYPLKKLLGISHSASCAVLMGILCGFPIGARTIISLLDNEQITEKEASRLLTFCNNPSSGFIVSAVGVSLYSNKKIGIILYTVTLVSAVLIGFAQRFFSDYSPQNTSHKTKYYFPKPDIFTSSVSGASYGMLSVCGYVVFFSTIIGCLSNILSPLNLSNFTLSFIYGFFELSGGVSLSSTIGTSIKGLCLSAFIIGWSGLSVHFQVMSVCNGYNISFKKYFLAKFFQAILNSTLIFIIFKLFPSLLHSSEESTVSITMIDNKYIILILLLFIFSILYSVKNKA